MPIEKDLATPGGRPEFGVTASDGRERLTVPMSVSSSISSTCTGWMSLENEVVSQQRELSRGRL